MKKILTTLALLVATTILLAQAPQKFSYQGVIRDAAGNLVRNAPVGVRVSLLKNSTEGVAVYCETHRQSTNANGLLTLTIGDGTVVGGDMAAIDWADGPYFLKTETDITGGSNYTLVGAQQLLSVPYALYAGNTTNAFSGDYNDLSNKPEIPVVPNKVSAFENDAHYLTEANLAARLDALQQQLDSLKEQIGEGGGSGHGGVGNDGKPCSGAATIMDVDSNIYNTVQIGAQCWMKENLKTTIYADGTAIQGGGSNYSYNTPYWYYPHNDSIYKADYGLLYNWIAVIGGSSSSSSISNGVLQGVCPTGWHVPSDAEWTQLTNYVSNQVDYVCYMTGENIAKSLASTTGWNTSNKTCAVGNSQSGNNATGFSAVPAGGYSPSGGYIGGAFFWSATSYSTNTAYYRRLSSGDAGVIRSDQNYGTHSGFSVRCLKD